MPTELSLLSPAKLNLFLHITGRLENGYHQLQTLFQLLDYGDTLHFSRLDSQQIVLENPLPGVSNQQNLIVKAATLLQNYGSVQQGVVIRCDKILPMGGGLGGGSSNAATTLLALNHLWNLKLPPPELCKLGLQLGADVPVFIQGKTAWGEGVGEDLTPVELPQKWFLVITPNCHISTAEIFLHPDLTRNTHPIKIRAFLEQGGHNDCQPIAEKLFPEVQEARQWLEQFGSAKMTGTGASIFAQFDSKQVCEQAFRSVPSVWRSFVAQGVNESPAIHKLNAG